MIFSTRRHFVHDMVLLYDERCGKCLQVGHVERPAKSSLTYSSRFMRLFLGSI